MSKAAKDSVSSLRRALAKRRGSRAQLALFASLVEVSPDTAAEDIAPYLSEFHCGYMPEVIALLEKLGAKAAPAVPGLRQRLASYHATWDNKMQPANLARGKTNAQLMRALINRLGFFEEEDLQVFVGAIRR
jgi:hypothetical protein